MSDDLQTEPAGPASAGLHAVIVAGDDLRVVELPARDELLVGRSRAADLVIDHATVSRQHARIRVNPSLAIQDLGGSNGTTVGGRRLTPCVWSELVAGEALHVGEVVIVLRPRAKPRVALDGRRLFERLDPTLAKIAAGSVSVLILGETGAGKEICAETIHRLSPRAGTTFLRLHCAALPEHLLEGELFGYERGAFTGAVAAKVGLLETAAGGTVFLDEVGELPPAVQVKLLRVLDSREVLRLGSLTPRIIDVRFVAATHRDLRAEVEAGRFREDLYYRLSAVTVHVPPLRERRDEILGLAAEFAAHATRDLGLSTDVDFTPEALAALSAYGWPGNVRELRNVVTRAVLVCDGGLVERRHLALEPPRRQAPTSPPAAADTERERAVATEDTSLGSELRAVERARILGALERSGGNQSRAARLLGMPRSTLTKRIAFYGLGRTGKL